MQGVGNSKITAPDADANPDEHILLHDMRRMLADGAFHDIVFVCGEEEEEIGACRMLVASRSPVLESMLLSSGMSENKLARIPLPNFDPITMRICVEFFYTDSVQDSSWHGILSAMKALKAATFFFLKRLERLAIEYMYVTSFRDAYEDEEWNAGIIEAYNLGLELFLAQAPDQEKHLINMRNLLDKFRVYVQNRVGSSTEKVFSGCKRERFFYKNLSDMAFSHILEAPKQGIVSKKPLSEYFLFLHLVRWSASRIALNDPSICEDEMEEVLNMCIPRSLDVISASIVLDVDNPRISRYIKLLTKQLATCLRIVPVQFDRIPTDILCRFIEPLAIVPCSILRCAYRSQALTLPNLQWDPLGLARKHSIDKDDMTVIASSKKKLEGFARCTMYLSTTKTTFFEWEIAILTPCSGFRIGFYIHRPATTRMLNHDGLALGEEKGSWAIGENGWIYSSNFEGFKRCAAYVDPLPCEERSIVQVHLDMANNQCSFTINGEEAGVAWSQLPFGTHMVYPAVSLTKPGKVQVRMVERDWTKGPLRKQQRRCDD